MYQLECAVYLTFIFIKIYFNSLDWYINLTAEGIITSVISIHFDLI